MSDWIRHAIWWQVYPLGFTGAEKTALPDGAAALPRLQHIEAWLPHLVALGCNGLALGPVFESGTHGYDTVDHRRINPELGIIGIALTMYDRRNRLTDLVPEAG